MSLTTINLNSFFDRTEIAVLSGIHNVEPVGSFKGPIDGDLYLVFVSNDETINILNDVQLAEEEAQKHGEYTEQDVVCNYVEERLVRNLPEIKEVIVSSR